MNRKYVTRWCSRAEKPMSDRFRDKLGNSVRATLRPPRFLAAMLAVVLAWLPLRVNAARSISDPGIVAADSVTVAGRASLKMEALLAEPDSWIESLAFDADKRVASAATTNDAYGDLIQPTLIRRYMHLAQQDTIVLDPETQKAMEELAGAIPYEIMVIAGIMVITYLIAKSLGWWDTE